MRTLALLVVVVGLPAFAGSLKGTVTYDGPPAEKKKLLRDADPLCAAKEMFDESLLTGKKGALGNVVVRVVDAPPRAQKPSGPAVLDQVDCMYRPRVITFAPGQKIQVRNSDGTLHNVRGKQAARTLFNRPQPPGSPPIERSAPEKADVLIFQCDVHPWMIAYAVKSPTGFDAVTDASGKFEIRDLPEGTWTVEVWHETLGTSRKTVKVGKDTAKVDFVLSAARQ